METKSQARVRIYVLETGKYEERHITAVYSTLAKALATNPIAQWDAHHRSQRGWRREREGVWSNGLDWDDAKRILEFEVDG